jgi:quercetin dioxygenase-like cupin family protein
MPKVSKQSATQGGEFGPVTDRSENLDGYTVGFTTFHVDLDQSPMLKGLPNDQCQCPHWGYVIKGRMTFRVGDREEVLEAGDAYYLPPGHVGISNEPDTELLQFSPADDLQKTSEVIMKNMQAMQGT